MSLINLVSGLKSVSIKVLNSIDFILESYY